MLSTVSMNTLIAANTNKGDQLKKSNWNGTATKCEIISLLSIFIDRE